VVLPINRKDFMNQNTEENFVVKIVLKKTEKTKRYKNHVNCKMFDKLESQRKNVCMTVYVYDAIEEYDFK